MPIGASLVFIVQGESNNLCLCTYRWPSTTQRTRATWSPTKTHHLSSPLQSERTHLHTRSLTSDLRGVINVYPPCLSLSDSVEHEQVSSRALIGFSVINLKLTDLIKTTPPVMFFCFFFQRWISSKGTNCIWSSSSSSYVFSLDKFSVPRWVFYSRGHTLNTLNYLLWKFANKTMLNTDSRLKCKNINIRLQKARLTQLYVSTV